MRTIETDHWLCDLPHEWQAEQEDDSVVIIDDDEVSTIEISTLYKEEGEITDDELLEFSQELSDAGYTGKKVELGPFRGLQFTYQDDDGAWREWLLAAGSILLFVTHGCVIDHQGMDDGAVDEILSTLNLK